MAKNDDIKWLYGKLKAKGYNIGSEEDFSNSLANEADRKWYYEKATGMGLNIGSMDDFNALYAPKSVPNQTPDVKAPSSQLSNVPSPEIATIPAPKTPAEPAKKEVSGPASTIMGRRIGDVDWNAMNQPRVSLEDIPSRSASPIPGQESGNDTEGRTPSAPEQQGQSYLNLSPQEEADLYANLEWNRQIAHDLVTDTNERLGREGSARAQNALRVRRNNVGMNATPYKIGEKANVIQTGRKLNTKTGKVEQTFMTEAGSEYKQRAIADLEQGNIDDARERELDPINTSLRDAYSERDRIDAAMKQRMKEIDEENSGVGSVLRQFVESSRQPGMTNSMQVYQMDDRYRLLEAAARKNRAAIQTLEDKRDGKMNDFFHSIKTTALNSYTFTDGLAEINDAIALMDAQQHIQSINAKRQAGEPLNSEEVLAEIVLRNDAFNNAVQGRYAQEYGSWATAGQMIPTSMDLMKDIMLTPGAGSIAKGIAGKVSNLGGKYLAKQAGDAATKSIAKKVGRGILKGTGVLLGAHTAGAVISNTSGINRTAAVMGTNMAGHTAVDENGYKVEDDMGVLEAFADAERQMMRENGSEMFGEFIPGAGKFVKKGLEKMGLSKISAALTRIGNKQWYKQYNALLEAGGYNGIAGEGIEEYEGILFDALTGHAGEALDQIKDPRTHVDIWLGTAAMSAMMGAVPVTIQGFHTGQYYRYKHNTDNSDKLAAFRLGEDRWAPMRDRIDGTPNEGMADVAAGIINDESLRAEEKLAALKYIRNLTKMRGYNIGQMSNAKEESKESREANESYADGYNAETNEEKQDTKNLYVLRRQKVVERFSAEGLARVDNDPMRALNDLGADEASRQIILDYVNSKQAYDGMIQRVRDDLDSRIEQSNAMVDARTNQTTGMVQGATMKQDDRKVYVLAGELIPYDDGSGIDISASSQTIIVRDATTGELEQVAPDSFLSVDEPQDANEQKNVAAEAIRQQYGNAAADVIDGIVTFHQGATFSVMGQDGQSHQIQIVANEQGVVDNGDGIVNVSDGTSIFAVQKDFIQQQVNEQNQARVAEAERQREQELAAARQQAWEANRPQYAYDDDLVLRDADGNLIHGKIAAVEEADGIYVVDVDHPINGNFAPNLTREQIDDMIVEYNGQPMQKQQEPASQNERQGVQPVSQQAGQQMPQGQQGGQEQQSGMGQQPDTQQAQSVGVPSGRYSSNLEAIRNASADELMKAEGTSYTEYGVDYNRSHLDEYKTEIANKISATAEYLNGKLSTRAYLQSLGYATGEKSWLNSATDEELRQKAEARAAAFMPFIKGNQDAQTPVSGTNVPQIDMASSSEQGDNGSAVGITASAAESDVVGSHAGVTESTGNPGTVGEVANQQPSAFERIPKDEQGNPLYEQAETPDVAWDAIVEQTGGDEDMATEIISDIIKEQEAASTKAQKALKKVQEAKPESRKDGVAPTMAERIAAKKAAKEALASAQAEVDRTNTVLSVWQQIARTPQRRKNAEEERKRREDAERKRQEAEAVAAQKAEQEEAARIEREALNGVPDIINDTPQDARARGYRRVNGHKVNRQEPLLPIPGRDVSIKFSDDEISSGKVVAIDAAQLQPSHRQGRRNPSHFIDEAQPKERNDEASILSAEKIAGSIRPEEITSSVTAYTGAPTVNSRGEVIQGNNRSAALRSMWESYPEQAAIYKQYLVDHAKDFGLNAADVASMERPVLVNMLDVPDEEAIKLGQYVAQDTESGGTERIKPKNALQKMGRDVKSFANILLQSADEELSFSELVDRNGVDALKWMSSRGYITPTQYQSAFDTKGNITAEAKNDLKGILYQSIFSGGSTQLEEMFGELPAKAQKAILATAFRDFDSPQTERMITEIQDSIRAYHALLQDKRFREAKNYKEARLAVEGWKQQYQMDDVSGETYLPSDNFTNFALHLATIYKGESQTFIQSIFNRLYDLIQGTQEATLFEQPDNTPRTLAQAIYEVLNIQYDGQLRSNVLAGGSAAGQQRRQGSDGSAPTRERTEGGEQPADGTGGAEGSGRQGAEGVGEGTSQENLTETDEISNAERNKVLLDRALSEVNAPYDVYILGSMEEIEALEERNVGADIVRRIIDNYNNDEVLALYIPEIKGFFVFADNGRIRHEEILTPSVAHETVHYLYDIGKISAEDIHLLVEEIERLDNDLTEWVKAEEPSYAYEEEVLAHFIDLNYSRIRAGEAFFDDAKRNDAFNRITKILFKNGKQEAQVQTRAADGRASEIYEGANGGGQKYEGTQGDTEGQTGGSLYIDGRQGEVPGDGLAGESWSDGSRKDDRGEVSGLPEEGTRNVSGGRASEGASGTEGFIRVAAPEDLSESPEEANAGRMDEIAERLSEIDYRLSELEEQGGMFNEAERISLNLEKSELEREYKGLEQINAESRAIQEAEAETDTEPTDAQKAVGNYKKGHLKIDGYDVTIENPKGSQRTGTDQNGSTWSVTMNNTYGYIRGTEGVDGDHIDVFLSDNPSQGNVYVVDQVNQQTGEFDEHKVMYGFNSMEEAQAAYLSNYSEGWKMGTVTEVSKEEFKKWIQSSHRKTKPFAEYASVKKNVPLVQKPVRNGESTIVQEGTTQSAKQSDRETIVSNFGKEFINKDGHNIHISGLDAASNTVNVRQNGERISMTEKEVAENIQSGQWIPKQETEAETEGTGLAPKTDGYNVERRFHKKNGTYIYAVNFAEKMPREQFLELKKRVKDFGGYYSSYGKGGFIFDKELDANNFAQAVLDPSGEMLDDKTPLALSDMRKASDRVSDANNKKSETVSEPAEQKVSPVSSENRLVSDQRYEELKKRMKAKLGQLNMGIDPEMIAIGAEMAVYHIERGARSFSTYAKSMIADLGDTIRPYLKSFYNAVRDMPEAVEGGLVDEMTPYDEVRTFDVANFDKSQPNAFTTAQTVVVEQEINKKADEAKQHITDQRNAKRRKENEQTTSNTEALISKTEIVANNAAGRIEEAETEAEVETVQQAVDIQLQAIDEQLSNLGYLDNLHSGMHAILKDGRNVVLTLVMHSGEQVSATQFSKPRIDRLYASHKGSLIDFTPDEVDIDATIRINDSDSSQSVEPIGNDDEVKSYRGYKVGDKVLYTPKQSAKSEIATIHDFESYGEHKPVLDTGLAPVLYDIAEWDNIKPASARKTKEDATNKSQKDAPSNKSTADLFGELFGGEILTENKEENGLQGNDAVRSEGLSTHNGRHEERLSGSNEKDSQRQAETSGRSDGGRENSGSSLNRDVRSGLSDTVENPKNTRNNHSERGVDHAPISVDARIDANIKAIELSQQLLESGETATPDQMAILRRFSGWGGLGKAFNSNTTSKRLQDLLGSEGFNQAVMSANSAYYTPAYVVDTLWDIAAQMGFKGGNILEGSAGIGNILGQMPASISQHSNIQAVEIDQTSGNILSLLYPDAKVEIHGFEETLVKNGTVDLAITNVPFVTGLRVNDTSGDKDLSKKFHNIHDFCIAKNVRKLREGGIGIFISSNGTLDNSKKLRDWVVNEGNSDFVGAFRMNNATFGGTSVTSDIIVIRKRINGQKSPYSIDVSTVSGERTAEFDTGDTRKVKGESIPVVKQVSMDYNQYFMQHPEYMAGNMRFGFEEGDTYRPTSKGLYPSKGKDQRKMLADFVEGFSEKDWKISHTDQLDNSNSVDSVSNASSAGKKVGEMYVKDGNLVIANLDGYYPLEANANKVKGHTKVECFNAYSAIKEALAAVLDYQVKNDTDKGLQPLLDRLNKAYDDFVATYGHFNKNTAIAFLRNDVDYPNVFSLETYEETGDMSGKRIQHFGKTDVFKNRVVEKEKEPAPKNVKDGIIASIFKFGRIDMPYISGHLAKTETDIKNEILKSGYGFENPVTREIEVSFRYLSGNVREKLRQAEVNNEDGVYDRNIKALQEVLPMDIPAHLIDFTLGSSWIDPRLYDEYTLDRTGIEVQFTSAGGTWFMKAPTYGLNVEKNRSMGVVSEMLRKTIFGHTLIEAAIQNKSITVSQTSKKWDGTTETIIDKEATQACAARIDEIRQDFKEWARQKMQTDPAMSAQMERVYNDMFNNYVPLSIPNEFIPEYFGGASHKFKMRLHQGKAIVRGTMQPLMLAHEVGTGKTFTLISTAMEMRRLGTARKPMIVVQNATVGQFVASAKELYPNARILTLEESDRSAEGRKNFYAKIRYNDWDMIVVPQSTFEFIPDSEERQMAFIQDKIEEKKMVLEQMKEADPDGSSMIARQAEREIEQLEGQLAEITNEATKKRSATEQKKRAVSLQNMKVRAWEMLDRRTDDVENFDDMGIDALLIDEAHEYKHLGFATAMQRGVKGVDPSYSKKSQGVYLKAQAILEKNNGRNVIFATGTPISNTAAELWTFMRYLMPADTMREYGIYYFDDFVRNFGNIQQMLEFTTSGKFKENNRFAGYVNLPELVRIWSSVSDTVLTKEAGGVSDKIPDMESGKAQDIYLPQTRALRSIMKYVKAELNRFDNMSGKEKKENSHIPLTMYGIAKAAAVDARLVQADAMDDSNSKTNEAVRQTLRSLKETEDYKGTVALFADNYQNKYSGFNLYDDIRDKLIKEGVPAEQIVIMRSGMTIKKKLEIFDKVNKGEIRVIMGSTFTLGTGVNIQERLHTLIHIDAPNRPMDYTQRNGRILRQGNLHKQMNKPVRVLRFGVEDSLDVTAYQRLKTKGAIADSIMDGKNMLSNSMTNRVLEEEEDVFGDTVAQLSGSEYALLKNNAEKNVRKYESRKKQWQADQTYIHNVKPKIKAEIEQSDQRFKEQKQFLEDVNKAFPDGTFKGIKVGNHTFSTVESMSDFIKEYNKSISDAMKHIKGGGNAVTQQRNLTISLGGFTFNVQTTLSTEMVRSGGQLIPEVHRKMTYSCAELGLSEVPVHQGLLRNAIEDIVGNVITGKDFSERAAAAERSASHYRSELAQLESREGKPFEFEKELEAAREQYEEYSEAMKKEMEDKEAKYAEMDASVDTANDISNLEEDDVLFRIDDTTTNEEEANDLFRVVDNEAELEWLNNEPTIKVYRAMSLVDGKLYPPMSKKIGTGAGRIEQISSEIGQWEVSDERPELVQKDGVHKNHIYIVKDNGKGLWVAYNPYFHTSRNPLNDQFAEAYQRPNLVTVEVEIPESELTSGYRAEGAKDAVGETKWNAGPVNRQLSGEKKRKVILSRWMRPVRIVPESEVAQRIAELIDGENVSIPDNTVTPALLRELKKLGVEISDGINKVRKKSKAKYRPYGLEEANRRFNEELERYQNGEMGVNEMFHLGMPQGVMRMFLPDLPIVMRPRIINKASHTKHNVDVDVLENLPERISDPVFVFRRSDNALGVLTEIRDRDGLNVCVAIELNKTIQDGGDYLVVHDIRSIHGRDAANLIKPIVYNNTLVYVDKKKALEWFSSASSNYQQEITNQELSDATKVVESFKNPSISEENLRKGTGFVSNSELSLANDPMSQVTGRSRIGSRQQAFADRERERMVDRVQQLAKKLHLDNVEIVTDASTLEGKRSKAKGFYSPKTGKITIVIPNHTSVSDAVVTLLHEAVAHYGLRQMFGEHFNTFLDNVFKNADESIRNKIIDLAKKHGWDFHTATEEYLAGLAEQTNFDAVLSSGWWNKIKTLFLEMLHKIGFEGFGGVTLADNELRYILWRSYENLAEPGRFRNILGQAADIAKQYELKVGDYAESTQKGENAADVGDELLRDGDPEVHERELARWRYEQRVRSGMFQTQEALQDSMLGLKEAMLAILGKEADIEDVAGFENAYLGENRLSSVNKAEADAFARILFKPLLQEVSKLAPTKKDRELLTDYMMAKHGLERNLVMAEREAQEAFEKNQKEHPHSTKTLQDFLDKYRERDYAGLTSLTAKDDVASAETEAQQIINDYEMEHNTDDLWEKVNAVSKATLQKSYECGMMNKDTYEKISGMYDYYIPLRGFDETTSEEVYSYLNHKNSIFNAPIKTARGRSSKADDPFAYLQSMAESAIVQGNRNKLVKQRFLNFALNHPSDLVSISDLWVKYDKALDEWVPVFPDNIENNDTPDDVEQKMLEFEEKMEQLAESEPDLYKRGKDAENIPYRVVDSRNLRQHQVVVKRNGRDYVITINGNPRAAQALNGLTNPDNEAAGAIGAILRAGENLNRHLSAFYTTRNPDFVVSNFVRDLLYTNTMAWVKESPNYALRFHRNYLKLNPARMKILLAKLRNGTLDMDDEMESMFYQFIMNGGETGYANLRDIEQHKNDIRRELKKANGKIGVRRAWALLSERLDELNRSVENCARFAAFVTSREMGRTLDRSIYDAKEISVNFNKKGSGAKFFDKEGQTKVGNVAAFASGIGRSGYVFWNAAIQGTTNFGRQLKKHPAKAYTGIAAIFLLGALVAYLGGDDDDSDDKNAYYNLPEYVRRSNLLFRAGDSWISLPLPVEYRAIYGMGELMVSTLNGKEHHTGEELAEQIAAQMSQILPLDLMNDGGLMGLVPSFAKPFAEVYENKNWTGLPIYKDTPWNKNKPEWTKAYQSTNRELINLAAVLNEVSGGDRHTKGYIDINPAMVEHLLEGYFGGVASTIDKLAKTVETIAGAREYDPRSLIFVNRLVKAGDERTEFRAVNNEYSRLKKEHDKIGERLRSYEKDTDNGVFDYAEKIDYLYNSPEYERWEIFESYKPAIDALYDEMDIATPDEQKEIEMELNELKKEMIQEIDLTRK